MKFSKRLILIFIVSIFCVGCDQTTKSIAVSTISELKTFSYFGDTLRLQLAYNGGGFLSLGASLPDVLRHLIFIVGISFSLLGALVFVLLSEFGNFSVVLAVSLVFAGGVGNLIDRVIHDGFVVDFISIGVGPIRTGIFNVADVAIMGGSIFLCLVVLRKPKKNHYSSI
jgi:signal peptidase II